MTNVISSPERSATGFFTLILFTSEISPPEGKWSARFRAEPGCPPIPGNRPSIASCFHGEHEAQSKRLGLQAFFLLWVVRGPVWVVTVLAMASSANLA